VITTAKAAMQNGNYAEAYCHWMTLAEKGHPEAQYNIGWMYHNGYGLIINDQKASLWWQEAASQNYTEAIFSLAMLYLGEGNSKANFPLAMTYLLQASIAGHEEGKIRLTHLIAQNRTLLKEKSENIIKKYASLFAHRKKINKNKVNIRATSHLKSPILAVLNKGESVIEFKRYKKWSLIGIPQHKGLLAWVYHAYLSP
jgi:TPR repeat protein